MYSLNWLANVLEESGLKVAEVDGWLTRGRGEMTDPIGIICHHTAGPRTGNMPSLNTLIHGRSDLPGPLSQLGLGRDGTYYVIAAGRCNHAGAGKWQGETQGNSKFIGIEAENTGRVDDPWPEIQLKAYLHGVAAILRHLGRGAEFCAGHGEYALPKGRKNDPSFDMTFFRSQVEGILRGEGPAIELIPKNEPDGEKRETLRRGASGDLVRLLQGKLGLVMQDGVFGPHTEVTVREFQRQRKLVADGIVGPKTWTELDK